MKQIFNYLGIKTEGEYCIPIRFEDNKKPVTLTSGGVKDQDHIYYSPQKAWEAYNKTFEEYTEDAKVIYWRTLPKLVEDDDVIDGYRCYVASRLYVEHEVNHGNT